MLFSSRNYAIGMAHFQIAGGMKSLLGLGVAYVAGAASIIGIVLYNTNSAMVPGVMTGLFTMFFVIEAFIMVMLGGFRVGGCIRTDLATNMIESHRQMPIAAWRAMTGYLLGTTAHVMALTALNVLVLMIMAGVAGLSFDNFVISQIVLGMFALFVWSFAAMNTFMFRQIVPLMVLGVMFGGISSAFLRNFGILPGMSLLISPFLGESIFNLSRGMLSIRAAYPIALTAQGAFAALFFVGACRRYRGTYLTTFNVPLGLGLVAVWAVLSVASIRIWPSLTTGLTREFGRQPGAAMQVVASLVVGAMVMIVPVHALAAWESRHRVDAPVRMAALLGAGALGLLILLGGPVDPSRWMISALVIGTHVAMVYLALRAFRIFTPMTVLVLMAAVMLGQWLMPLLAEGLLTTFFPGDGEMPRDFSLVGSASPLGLLLKVWADLPPALRVNPIPGLLCQMAGPLVFWWFGRFLARRNPEGAV